MGLGLLFAGLSGAGKGLAESAEQSQKVMDEERLMAERARLEEEKILRIEQVRADRTRAAGVKQGQDIEAGVSRIQDERIASKIHADDGPNLSAEDVRAKRDQPGGSAIEGLLNSSRQSKYDDQASAADKLGYSDAAKEYRNSAQTEATNRRNDENVKADNARQDKQLGAQVAHWKALEARSGGDASTKELAALKLKEFQIEAQWKSDLAKTPVGSPERAALMQKGRDLQFIKDAPNDVTTSVKRIDEEGNEITTTTKGQAQKPKGKTGWDSTTGDVYRNGAKVGTAKTEAEARRLAAGGKGS